MCNSSIVLLRFSGTRDCTFAKRRIQIIVEAEKCFLSHKTNSNKGRVLTYFASPRRKEPQKISRHRMLRIQFSPITAFIHSFIHSFRDKVFLILFNISSAFSLFSYHALLRNPFHDNSHCSWRPLAPRQTRQYEHAYGHDFRHFLAV